MRETPITQKKDKKRVGPKPSSSNSSSTTTSSSSSRRSARKAEESNKKQIDTNNLSLDAPVTASLFENIKKQLANDETYQEFLKCVNMFSNGVIGKQELIRLANDIIGEFTDSFKSFKKLVSTSSSAFGKNFFFFLKPFFLNRRKI